MNADRKALAVLLVLVSLALGWVLWPYAGSVLWAAIIALLFEPLHRLLLPRLRQRRSQAAALTMVVVVLVGVLPAALVSAALTREAAQLYGRLQSGEVDPARYFRAAFEALPAWLAAPLRQFGLADFDALQAWLGQLLAQGGEFLATQAFSLGQNTFELVTSVAVTLYLAFFFIRDGASLVHAARHALPLAPAQQQALVDKFSIVIRATVRGNLLVALVQGALGGLAFWFLGIGGAVLWAVLMAFLSLLPAVGAALVWGPVALALLFSGQVGSAVALGAWGVLVIGLVDNLLRPMLVGKDTRLPDYVVMITTLGGMAVFGLNGFVIGPAVAAMFMTVWQLHVAELEQT